MAGYRYATKTTENMAKAVGRSLPISAKQSIEICNFIRKRSLDSARRVLSAAMEKKEPIPFKRFTGGLGHKKGMASGRFPQKACGEILKIINVAEANAQHKGLSGNLRIKSILAQRASAPWHPGRKRRRRMKRTHIEVVVEEFGEKSEKGKTEKKSAKAAEKKPRTKRTEQAGAVQENKEEVTKKEDKK